jgi:hypothetical protein
MAAPTPTTNLYKNGRAFVSTWNAVWANTDDMTDVVVADLSALNNTNRIRILQIHVTATAGIAATLEFDDASSDVLIYRHPLGVVGNIVLDFTHIDGLIWDGQTTSDTGDILITTASAASADEVSVVVVGRSS